MSHEDDPNRGKLIWSNHAGRKFWFGIIFVSVLLLLCLVYVFIIGESNSNEPPLKGMALIFGVIVLFFILWNLRLYYICSSTLEIYEKGLLINWTLKIKHPLFVEPFEPLVNPLPIFHPTFISWNEISSVRLLAKRISSGSSANPAVLAITSKKLNEEVYINCNGLNFLTTFNENLKIKNRIEGIMEKIKPEAFKIE